MKRVEAVYSIYILFFLLLVGIVIIIPLLAFDNDMEGAYKALRIACHQKLSRSFCIFSDGSDSWIADCTEQKGEYTAGDQDEIRVERDGAVGYKIAVCSRDLGLYAAMLVAGLIYPLVKKLEDREVYPGIYLVIALIPIGLDGGIQFFSDLGILPFVYESTNLIRLVTGAIAGFAATFFAIPIIVNMFSKD